MKFKKILIANRGEIAIRVIRSARAMGIQTVAVYSEADRDSLHVLLADEAYLIGPAESAQSYLQAGKIIDVALKSGAEAIHPGYGFLSENAQFARDLNKAGLIFIGPTPENIEAMGDKLASRELMKKASVPTVPGTEDAVSNVENAAIEAEKIGYPVMIKASAGGGGKGIRVVHGPKELASSFRACQSEGLNYFKDDRVFIERFIQNPKHIEVQVFGDKHGHVVHLYERECSGQRRHQKVIEEAPSISVPSDIREKLCSAAVKAAQSINYVGAGTVEFIFDNSTKEFFFMEMNTRLQVEHPVTEMITGRDLVREQISVAAGYNLTFTQDEVSISGHSIECRICAEDPKTFAPSPGKIRLCRVPQGEFTRVDGCAYPGYEIPIYYDPMIAKLITWGKTREECIGRMKRALAEFMLTGIKTNIVLHKNILEHPHFIDGSYTTQFIENELSNKSQRELFMFVDDHIFIISAAIKAYQEQKRKDTSRLSTARRWKTLGRQSQLRN